MNKRLAIQKMLDGAKVRHKSFHPNSYIFYEISSFKAFNGRMGKVIGDWNINNTYFNSDWEIVEEFNLSYDEALDFLKAGKDIMDDHGISYHRKSNENRKFKLVEQQH